MKNKLIFLLCILFLLIFSSGCSSQVIAHEPVQEIPYEPFDGERAWQDVDYQVALGARTPGSPAHAQTTGWIEERLRGLNWEVEVQELQVHVDGNQRTVRNVIAKTGAGRPWLVLGAHYDTRLVADRDPDFGKRSTPVPGGNDGASGVAVLLELGRILPNYVHYPMPGSELRAQQIWLVFFDAEDNGKLAGWDWILGSQAFVDNLAEKPDAAVIVDMIGDAQLDIYMEKNSDPQLRQEIWDTAAALGYDSWFIPEEKHRILDDHVPFIEAGIPAVDLIDMNYAYWHTTQDTADKVSPESLQIVGDTLLSWLVNPSPLGE